MCQRSRRVIALGVEGQRIGRLEDVLAETRHRRGRVLRGRVFPNAVRCFFTEALATGTALTASLLLAETPRSGSVSA